MFHQWNLFDCRKITWRQGLHLHKHFRNMRMISCNGMRITSQLPLLKARTFSALLHTCSVAISFSRLQAHRCCVHGLSNICRTVFLPQNAKLMLQPSSLSKCAAYLKRGCMCATPHACKLASVSLYACNNDCGVSLTFSYAGCSDFITPIQDIVQ